MESPQCGEWVRATVNYHYGSINRLTEMLYRVYDFFLNAIEIDENGELNPNTTFYVRSNKFEIVGGRAPLRPIQIAGITVGSVAAVILLAVIWAVCARLWRQRRSLAVDLSEHNEGGYTDNAGR